MNQVAELKSGAVPFKPRARMLLLLGDQLIREPGIAVFELVKNAYDADAPDAKVIMSDVGSPNGGTIIIEDSGSGMDWDTVVNVWLEPGTDYRAQQKLEGKRTQKFNRSPIGEKGIGRFAAHKLGLYINMITRRKGQPEVTVEFNWERFEDCRYLSKVPVKVAERVPRIFTGRKTGTRIEITNLRDVWTRGMVRDLSRSITAISSPFEESDGFRAKLELTNPEEKKWLSDLLTIETVKKQALFNATCFINNDELTYDYEFNPYPVMRSRVKSRKQHISNLKFALRDPRELKAAKKFLKLSNWKIGPIRIDLFIFDLDPQILALGVSDKKGLRNFLKEAGGVRVYRDGIRVYDYGEPGNDWLNLGGRRVNIPTRRIGNNLVIGTVSLNLEDSSDLIEKTNREGFVFNEAYVTFQAAVVDAVLQIETERNKDKKRIRDAYGGGQPKDPVLSDVIELRRLIEERGLKKELGSIIDRIESDFLAIRDRFLTSASAGLSLTVVIHEVEKGIDELAIAVKRDHASPRVIKLATHLAELIEGLGSLARRSGASQEKASALIKLATFNTELRLAAHGIKLELDVSQDFQAKCSKRLTVATLMNLIDNSIWWLDNKWGMDQPFGRKKIYIGISNELGAGPAIIVADNGPGFVDPPEYLTEPFITRKQDGMGLGLHLADQVMKVQGGYLEFPERGDLSLAASFDGAVIALVFGGAKWMD